MMTQDKELTLAQKIARERREKRYTEIVRQIRLRHFEHSDCGKLEKSQQLIRLIRKRVLIKNRV